MATLQLENLVKHVAGGAVEVVRIGGRTAERSVILSLSAPGRSFAIQEIHQHS